MSPREILSLHRHRPWPLPDGPWVMRQNWRDLLFLHWPVCPGDLTPLVRPPLRLDTFDGAAWIGLVPFCIRDIRLRGMPPLPGLTGFAELNVRTYVRYGDRPGVLFLSLDAAHCLLAAIARRWYRLPYHHAAIQFEGRPRGEVAFTSRRRVAGVDSPALAMRYRPIGPVAFAPRGSLAAWLTERYCLYTFDCQETLLRAEIHHQPWPLQPAEAEVQVNTMFAPFGVRLEGPAPLAHFSRAIESLIWTPRAIDVHALRQAEPHAA